MSESITISFVGSPEIKIWLEQWAREDDRSMSYVLRQILKREAQRRVQTRFTEQKTIKQIH